MPLRFSMLHKPLQTLLVHLRSLKVRLALIGTLALAAGIGLSTALLMQRAERDTLQLAQVHQLEQAVHSARLLGVRLRDAHRALADALPQLNGPLIDDFSALQAFGATNPVLRGLFDSIFVVGGDGRLNLLWDDKGPRSPRTDLSDRPYFQVAMTEGRATVSDLFVGRVNSEPMVALAQPLVVQGRPVAVLVGGLMLLRRDIASVFTDASMDGQDPQIVVITDATGRILSHPQQGLVGAPLSAEPRMLQALARWRALGQPMWSSGQELGGSHGLAAVAGVPGADWLVWTWRDKTAVLAPLLAGRTQAMLAALVLLVLMGVGLLAIMARTLRPLALLQARAHRLFDAQRSTQDDWPAAQGVIGDLARVLRHVAAEKAQLETFTAQVIQRLQSVMAAAPVGICFTRKRRFELVSAEFCRLMGRGESLLLGQETHIIYASSEEFEALGPSVAAAFQAGRQFDAELRFRRGDGSCFTGRLRGQPVDAASSEAGTIWSLSDVTEDVAAREALQWAAAHDALTGLANRKALEQRLTRVFDLLPRPLPAALLLLDLDRFKPVNDVHGHAAGDAVLCAVATAIQACARSTDMAVRLGGDEFAVVLEHCRAEVALRIAEEIRAAISSLCVPWNGRSLQVGASVGVALLDDHVASPAAWLAAADKACYAAKACGRNQVQAVGDMSIETDTLEAEHAIS